MNVLSQHNFVFLGKFESSTRGVILVITHVLLRGPPQGQQVHHHLRALPLTDPQPGFPVSDSMFQSSWDSHVRNLWFNSQTQAPCSTFAGAGDPLHPKGNATLLLVFSPALGATVSRHTQVCATLEDSTSSQSKLLGIFCGTQHRPEFLKMSSKDWLVKISDEESLDYCRSTD